METSLKEEDAEQNQDSKKPLYQSDGYQNFLLLFHPKS